MSTDDREARASDDDLTVSEGPLMMIYDELPHQVYAKLHNSPLSSFLPRLVNVNGGTSSSKV